mgnify:CR=1 FL=1
MVSLQNSNPLGIDALDAFFSEGRHHRRAHGLLSREQELKLATTIRDGNEAERKAARNTFAEANQGLVVSIAKTFIGRGIDLQDLISIGNEGLVTAIDQFNPIKFNTKFSTYAPHWIKQTIRRDLAQKRLPIDIPQHIVELDRKLRRRSNLDPSKTDRDIMQEMLLDPSLKLAADSVRSKPENLARATTKKLNLIQAFRACNKGGFRRDSNDDRETSFRLSTIPQRKQRTDEIRSTILDIEKFLNETYQDDERAMRIIKERILKPSPEKRTLKNLGEDLDNLSRERIRQIEAEILRKVRENFKSPL